MLRAALMCQERGVLELRIPNCESRIANWDRELQIAGRSGKFAIRNHSQFEIRNSKFLNSFSTESRL